MIKGINGIGFGASVLLGVWYPVEQLHAQSIDLATLKRWFKLQPPIFNVPAGGGWGRLDGDGR